MKRLVKVVILVTRLVALVLLGLNDSDISIADISIPYDGIAGSVNKAANSTASAIIAIAICPLPNE